MNIPMKSEARGSTVGLWRSKQFMKEKSQMLARMWAYVFMYTSLC